LLSSDRIDLIYWQSIQFASRQTNHCIQYCCLLETWLDWVTWRWSFIELHRLHWWLIYLFININYALLQGGKHYVVWEDPFKKPCYLFALVAGQLDSRDDTFITHSGLVLAFSSWKSYDDTRQKLAKVIKLLLLAH
jgi:hypothetical protein